MARILKKIRDWVFNSDIKRSLEDLTTQNQNLKTELAAIRNQIHGLHEHNQVFTDISLAPPARGNLLLQQEAGAKMLEIFDAICRKNNLVYWLGAGNLIGIVRHRGGAVPWDDDVDVYMPREDFEKAVAILPKLFKGSDFGLIYRGFSLKFARYKGTAISFDIFPIDQYYKKIENDQELDALHAKIVSAGLYSSDEWLGAAGYGPNWDDFFIPIWEGGNVKTPEEIIKIKEQSLARWNKSLMDSKPPTKDGHLVKGYERAAFPARQYSWKHDWVFPLKREKYMGIKVNIPNNPDAYLRSQYGDYWGIPNDFHRHTSHFGSKFENIDDLKTLATLDIKSFSRQVK